MFLMNSLKAFCLALYAFFLTIAAFCPHILTSLSSFVYFPFFWPNFFLFVFPQFVQLYKRSVQLCLLESTCEQHPLQYCRTVCWVYLATLVFGFLIFLQLSICLKLFICPSVTFWSSMTYIFFISYFRDFVFICLLSCRVAIITL